MINEHTQTVELMIHKNVHAKNDGSIVDRPGTCKEERETTGTEKC